MKFPLTRLRRLRENVAMRRLCTETSVSCADLIYPVFVHAGSGRQEIQTLPGLLRHDSDSMLAEVEACAKAGLTTVALFPAIDATLKTSDGTEAHNPDGLIPHCISRIAERFPHIGVMADIALDPYTDHGHDGIVGADGAVDNDVTVAALVQQSIMLAQSGCQILAPSDMMDGRIGAIRQALENDQHPDVALVAYSAKYASAFYGPFRDAVGAGRCLGEDGKRGYQIDPACVRQAISEGQLDIDEGADAVMVKPALPYLDIISAYRQRFETPVFAFQVSGEYAMIKLAAAHGCLSEADAVHESLLCIKRAGADAIVSYFALTWANTFGRHGV